MTIRYNGNVGIGTTAPAKLLQVARDGDSSVSAPYLRIENTHTTIDTANDYGGIEFYANDISAGGVGVSGFIKSVAINAGVTSALTFGSRNTGNATEMMRINNLGYVGIGTTAPNDILSITDSGVAAPAGSSGTGHNHADTYLSTDDYALTNYGVVKTLIAGGSGSTVGYWGLSGSNLYASSTAWNVGIGTTAPTLGKLQIDFTGEDVDLFAINYTSSGVRFKVYNQDWGGTLSLYDGANNHNIKLAATANAVSYIANGGNVGIGTTNPSQRLEVNGIIKSTGMITTWKSARLDPTNSKWHKIGTLTLTGQYHTYQGTFMTHMRGITNDNDVTSIYKFTARQPAMTSSPIVDIHHLGSVSNNGTSFDVKAIITADTESSKTIDLYVGNVNSSYLYYSHSILNQSIEVGGSFSIVEGDTGVLVGSLPAGTQIDMIKGLTTLNSGYVGIGTVSPPSLLSLDDGGGITGSPKIEFNSRSYVGYYSGTLALQGRSGKGISFNVNNDTFGSGTAMLLDISGRLGIGTTAPNDIFSITNSGVAAPAGSSGTGHNYADTYLSEDDYALANYGLVKTLIAGTSGTYETGGYLPLAGGDMQGYIDMSGYSIDQVGTLTVEKLNATTIDPLYFLNGINYATFVSSVVGGVKEEYVGKIKINRKVAVPTAAEVKTEFEAVIDFAKTEEGGELWVWRQIVDFSKDSVDVLITPYGEFASVYYLIQDNKLIFRSDRPAEISYRLIGKRFDWRKWPLKVKDQTRQGVKVK
ncbi:TPA: hypothetical protein DCZ15_02305 [Candidatus Falkowbacteria bacterium]|nr:hypothetical protein [Candidatus Falkowbacteria bacterium]